MTEILIRGPFYKGFSSVIPIWGNLHFALIHFITTTSHGLQVTSGSTVFFNSLFRLTRKKTSKLCTTCPMCRESMGHQWIPNRGPMMRKAFPCHDIIMFQPSNHCTPWQMSWQHSCLHTWKIVEQLSGYHIKVMAKCIIHRICITVWKFSWNGLPFKCSQDIHLCMIAKP